MKNIHVLPTEKYSDLVHSTNKYGGLFLSRWYSPMKEMGDSYQNIYITSDEEIKEGEWVYNEYQKNIIKFSIGVGIGLCKKIILTTDPDLIKDGVQAVDDEFLEWFVKNPSCEWVEITEFITQGEIMGKLVYKISEAIKQVISKKLKQETLEEAAENYVNRKGSIPTTELEDAIFKQGFLDGAKWQADRMYSEEEVIEILTQRSKEFGTKNEKFQKLLLKQDLEWFEQFKKR